MVLSEFPKNSPTPIHNVLPHLSSSEYREAFKHLIAGVGGGVARLVISWGLVAVAHDTPLLEIIE